MNLMRNSMIYRPEYDLKVIGENLKRLRKAKGLSVNDVREYLRLGSVQAVYKYENGKCYPQVDTMFALMELYEAELSDIIYKHEATECSLNEDNWEKPFSDFNCNISKLNTEIEVINMAIIRKWKIVRYEKYLM